MSTRNYRFYVANSVASADAIASLRIVKKGKIVSINYAICGLSGAAIDGRQIFEISKQSIRTTTTNDTPPSVLSHAITCQSVSSGAYGTSLCHVGMAQAVDVGDTIYLHKTVTLTAPASEACNIDIQVEEGN